VPLPEPSTPTGQTVQVDASIGYGYYPFKRLAASVFLREVIPKHCLTYLRFLEFVFPPYFAYDWPRSGHEASQDWRATVTWLRDKINSSILTIRLIMTGTRRSPYNPPPGRETMTRAEGRLILDGYWDIASPLRHLAEGNDGLARFYTELALPWAFVEYTQQRLKQHDGDYWFDGEEEKLEKRVEHGVMGDRYEARFVEKNRRAEKSVWQYWRDPFGA